ncbi:MAG: hypothetical protein EOP68_24540, partial [Sphingomonas sp.]
MILALLLAGATATPPALAAPTAAAEVVRRYYALLDAHRYREAFALWDRGGAASGHNYAAFRRGYARTVATRVTVSVPTDPEGAAGSQYI